MKTKLEKEFEEFLNESSDAGPSLSASSVLFQKVEGDLNPNSARVFGKLMGIHALVTVFTLSVCPQFGFRILGEGMGLMHVFSALGEWGCLVACGSFFVGSSILAASFLLSRDEIRQIRRHRFLEVGSLTLLSLGFFFMLDLEIVLSLAAAWFVGALLGGQALLELGYRIRFRQYFAR